MDAVGTNCRRYAWPEQRLARAACTVTPNLAGLLWWRSSAAAHHKLERQQGLRGNGVAGDR